MRVSNQEFLTRLEAQFAASKEKHTIFLTKKRLSTEYDLEGDAQMQEASASSSSPGHTLIFRVTDGNEDKKKRVKFSTLVKAPELEKFEILYLPLMKAQMANSLRKRDKAKERKVDKLLVAKKKEIDENGGKVKLAGVGRKRGAGHRKRQRAEKRASKVRKDKAIAHQPQQATARPSGASHQLAQAAQR
ncbi:hypothetical protein K437DRAFT_248507 [Tilletiaria anomala UBC 951]|uniref:Signal recognition particle subunit SRP14 n=1 Tax=Tilletiaria anomala (strain ATCC 24038 / CBS 436.72 / UBC 951) TaxID=1037660 RepID=A0A066VXS1_TILAU|nr:uncharacterized protein K437DRAFT_248507 [Tilletiaria anomala UBC 951]KDN43320.1 hypothetical protein K437DRAFT_248507 [Tilletiaria anomala UBC 951]